MGVITYYFVGFGVTGITLALSPRSFKTSDTNIPNSIRLLAKRRAPAYHGISLWNVALDVFEGGLL